MKKIGILTLGLTLTFLSGALYLIDEWKFLQPYLLLGGNLFLLIFALISNVRITVNFKLFGISSLFLLSCTLSALINADSDLFIGTLVMALLHLSLVLVFPVCLRLNSILATKAVIYAVLLTALPLIIGSLLADGVIAIPYKGIFSNPNSFGSIALLLFTVVLAKVCYLLDEIIFSKNKANIKQLLPLMPALLGTLILIMYSNCRSAFLTAALLTLAYPPMGLAKTVDKGKIKVAALKRIVLVMYIFFMSWAGACLCTPLGALFKKTIIEKFESKAGNVLDGRFYIWLEILKETNLFGHGREYFSSFYLAAHNTYLSLLGQYGFIPVVFFLAFLLLGLCYTISYALRAKEDQFRYFPVLIMLNFMFLSLAEGMMFQVSMLSAYAVLGLAAVNLRRSREV